MDEVYWQPGMKMEDVEKLVYIAALNFFGGSRTRTANALGVTASTVRNKIEQYSIKLNCLGNQDEVKQ